MRSFFQPLFTGNYQVWVVLTELLVIGVPVYLILRFLRNTRGARLIKGVGLILLSSFLVMRLVAQEYRLDRVIFLYPYFVWSISLVALVVFQTELRRGLIRLGERGWFRSWARSGRHVIEPIVTAVGHLSKKKVGALIALERTTSLGGVLETGVTVDAALTAEMLETIFWPGSPLHDMGVIIQEGRIIAAACQFPLAESEDVDRDLGSRHRAALGLSEECDAIIIVVSEETGAISVAERGRLRRFLNTESLRALLEECFSPVHAPSRRGGRNDPVPVQERLPGLDPASRVTPPRPSSALTEANPSA